MGYLNQSKIVFERINISLYVLIVLLPYANVADIKKYKIKNLINKCIIRNTYTIR